MKTALKRDGVVRKGQKYLILLNDEMVFYKFLEC
jgi:hypothetical protein